MFVKTGFLAAKHSVLAVSLLVLAACGGGGGGSGGGNGGAAATPQAAAAPLAVESIALVESIRNVSEHYVAVRFREPVTGDINPDDCSITDETGAAVDIGELMPTEDPLEQMLVISPGTVASMNYTVSCEGSPGDDIEFVGDPKKEPKLESVVTLSPTQLMLTFDADMSATSTSNVNYYSVIPVENGVPQKGAPELGITRAELLSDLRTVILTTDIQDNSQYMVTVHNVTDEGDVYINPESNTAVIIGMGEDDTAAPSVARVQRPDPTTLSVNFSEPVCRTGGDSSHYALTYCLPVAGERQCPAGAPVFDAFVSSVELNEYCTQATLATSFIPPVAVVSLDVTGVIDNGGNVLDVALVVPPELPEPIEGAPVSPRLLSAVPLSPTRVLLTFNKLMAATSANESLHYRIIVAEDGRPHISLGELDILSAQLQGNERTVILTTAPQQNLEYYAQANNLTNQAGDTFLDPQYNADIFYGISPNDTTPPRVTRVVQAESTRIFVDFSEPVCGSGDDGSNYLVTYCVPEFGETSCDPGGETFELAVTDVTLNQYCTRADVNTASVPPSAVLTLSVTDVVDGSGNRVLPNATEISAEEDRPPVVLPSEPRVVAAISTSNTTIKVSFSNVMSTEAETAGNYSIVQENVNGEAGALAVTAAKFTNSSRTTVELTTLSQRDITYRVFVVDVRDEFEQSFAVFPGDDGIFTANTTTFAGTPVGGGMTVDTDGDGLADNQEQVGWIVQVENINGTVTEFEVTSDPMTADTDGDGLSDLEERIYSSDPRSLDTDSDSLSDNLELNVIYSDLTKVDTDGDSLADGAEYRQYQTSPIHADTDGDRLSDDHELFQSYRNPRIADLPELSIETGTMYVSLNEVYTYTDSYGEEVSTESSSSATIGRTNGVETLKLDENVTEELNTGGFAITGQAGVVADTSPKPVYWIQGTGYGEFSRNSIATTGTDTATVRESQQVLEESYAKGLVISSGSEVTRQVESATLNVELNLVNNTSLAYSVTDVEVTLLRLRPGTRSLEPVSSMLAQAGADTVYHLGPFNGSVGPLVFSALELPVTVAEELLRNPAGIVFKVSNYRITDEFGRVYTYINQEVHDRTAGLTIDYGFEGLQRQQMAASAMIDMDPASLTVGQNFGGFDDRGRPLGLPLLFLLENQLGWERNPTTTDAIIAGANRTSETAALDDDVQRVPVGTRGLGIGTVVIEAGANGQIDSYPAAGSSNREVVSRGFDVGKTCGTDAAIIYQGQRACSTDAECICRGDEDCPAEYIPANNDAAKCDGPSVITRVGGYANKPGSYRWVALTDTDFPTGADVEQLVLKPGENFKLAFVQDLDKDGMFGRTEFLMGTSDSPLNQEDNVEFGDTYAALGAIGACEGQVLPEFCGDEVYQPVRFALADSRDTDRDGIEDYIEAREGWDVAPAGQYRRTVYSSGLLRDSDGDGLTDWQERDIRFSCQQEFYTAGVNRKVDGNYSNAPYAKNSYVFNDYTIVGYPADYQNDNFIDDFITIVSGNLPGAVDDFLTEMVNFSSGASRFHFSKIAPFCIPDTPDPAEPGEYLSQATGLDPQSVDTDGDGVEDGAELLGYEVVEAIVASKDFAGLAPVLFAAYGDDVLLREFSLTIAEGDVIILPGMDGELTDMDANPGPDYISLFPNLLELRPGITVRSNPLVADTDGDFLSDGTELALGTNPVDPTDAGALLDSDQDGIFDIDESRGRLIDVNGAKDIRVRSNPTRADSDGDGLPDFVEYQIGSNPSNSDTDGDGLGDYDEFSEAQFAQYASYSEMFEGYILDGSSSRNYGTNLNERDSDGDNLTDKQEIDGFALFVPVQTLVLTNPWLEDSDGDGLHDDEELAGSVITNPMLYDTDGDGSSDGVETAANSRSNPLEWDVQVTLTITSLWLSGTEGTNDHADWQWRIFLQKPEHLDAPGETLESHYSFIRDNPGLLALNNDAKWVNKWILWGALGGSGASGKSISYSSGNIWYDNTIAGYEAYAAYGGWVIETTFAIQNNASSRFMRYPNVKRTIVLKEGDFFTLSGYVHEVDAIVDSQPDYRNCDMRFNKTFSPQDFASSGAVIADEFDMQGKTCEATITYTLTTDR
jgi:thrombospondin type 3 repeat protein/binary toxin B/toxin PA